MSEFEQDLRREAVRRRLNGERRKDICSDLERSTRWFNKWWLEFRNDPHTDFADHSRAPSTVSSIVTPELEQLVIELRRAFESANHGLIGARAIWGKLFELKVKPLPSEETIQRILARAGLTHPLGVATETAYYPWLSVLEVNAVQATDIITKHIRGGAEIQNFHTLDLFTHAACLTQHLDKTTWCKGFWSRQTFTDLKHVQSELPSFARWYHHEYRPPCLEGKTPAQMRFGTSVPKLTADLRRLIPNFQTERLPVTAGRFHFMRRVDATGYVEFLNERWLIGPKWIGEYVRATINTAKQTLTISHKANDDADWRVIKSRVFRIKESVHDLLPQFKRNRARCRDYLPG